MTIVRRLLVFALCCAALCCFAADEPARLQRLFAAEWEWRLAEFPEIATQLGEARYNDRLTDYSPEAIARRKASERDWLAQIEAIDRAKLTGQDLVSYDLFARSYREAVEAQRFPSTVEWAPVTHMDGVHLGIPFAPRYTPFRTSRDYRDYLARLRVWPAQVDQIIELLHRSTAIGWTVPRVPMQRVVPQLEKLLAVKLEDSPLYQPFKNFPAEVPATQRQRLAEEARAAIDEGIVPAFRRLFAFITGTYLPAARSEIAASKLPGGAEFYAQAIRQGTTTSLRPEEIHALGVKEVVRIHEAMEAVTRRVGYAGSLRGFMEALRNDPAQYFHKSEEVLPAYRDIAKRVDAELPKLFAELPRLPYGIREIPAYQGGTAEYYSRGAADGSRSGFFNANVHHLEVTPRYDSESLFLHEAVPGHHLQISRAQELKGLPEFRRNTWYNAYGEGWALYAESLGADLGLYTDPYMLFGRLNNEMWRACRLVVDTGIHALGWSRERAIAYLREHLSTPEPMLAAEIDRYIVWPGQALGYKVGELKIKELRARAKQALGEKFDIRSFHNALLDDGPLPLDLLEQRIDEWIKRQGKS